MKIVANLINQYGDRETKTLSFWGTLEQAKKDMAYIEYNDSLYEFVTYSPGVGGYDYEFQFVKTSYLPNNVMPYKIYSDYAWAPKKCECGSEKVGSPGHSFWCPKYIKM